MKDGYTVTRSVDVDIDVNIDDIITEIPTMMLQDELARREASDPIAGAPSFSSLLKNLWSPGL